MSEVGNVEKDWSGLNKRLEWSEKKNKNGVVWVIREVECFEEREKIGVI